MEEEKIYRQWKNHRMQVHVPDDFSVAVMQRIAAISHENTIEFPIGSFDWPRRLTRWSAAGGLILLGVFRIWYILSNLLQPHLLMR
jgi:hypothetical protein